MKDKGVAPPLTLNELVYIPRTLNSTWLFDLYLRQTLLLLFFIHNSSRFISSHLLATYHISSHHIYNTRITALFFAYTKTKKNKARDNDITMIDKIITAINQNGILLLLLLRLFNL